MAGSDDDFQDAGEFPDPEAVKREHSQQVEAIESKVAEDATEAKQGMMGRIARRAGASFKKGLEVVSSIVAAPKEQEMSDPSANDQQQASAGATTGAEADAPEAAVTPDVNTTEMSQRTSENYEGEFERSSSSMAREQDETRLKIKAEAEKRKAALKAGDGGEGGRRPVVHQIHTRTFRHLSRETKVDERRRL